MRLTLEKQNKRTEKSRKRCQRATKCQDEKGISKAEFRVIKTQNMLRNVQVSTPVKKSLQLFCIFILGNVIDLKKRPNRLNRFYAQR